MTCHNRLKVPCDTLRQFTTNCSPFPSSRPLLESVLSGVTPANRKFKCFGRIGLTRCKKFRRGKGSWLVGGPGSWYSHAQTAHSSRKPRVGTPSRAGTPCTLPLPKEGFQLQMIRANRFARIALRIARSPFRIGEIFEVSAWQSFTGDSPMYLCFGPRDFEPPPPGMFGELPPPPPLELPPGVSLTRIIHIPTDHRVPL